MFSARSSAILLHVTSLPSPHGIGDLAAALRFIDFLKASGQDGWQFLPLVPTSSVFGNSPYMSFSAFAGNPLLVSPELLCETGLLAKSDLTDQPQFSEYMVDYDKVEPWKKQLLGRAWERFQAQGDKLLFNSFCAAHDWLAPHACFMALKEEFDLRPWYEWPEPFRDADPVALQTLSGDMACRIEYFKFEQYLFFQQWNQVCDYARQKGIRLIGDLPIYVGLDSVDVWANRTIFELHKRTRLPLRVAGVPPDYFSKTGQLWGNPLYRWNARKGEVRKKLYDWWERRLAAVLAMVDIIRIDHFRGFEAYWSIPADDETAENGVWKRGPGQAFFREMEKRLGPLPVIAEDLGVITPAVEQLRELFCYPGMKVLQFAFDGRPDNPYLPGNYEHNCVVYTGTHDNDTAVGWFLDPNVPETAKLAMKKAANRSGLDVGGVHNDFIYLALSSTARLAVLPMQDILGFGSDCRMNTPGLAEGNWTWRCASRYFTGDLAADLRRKTTFFGRGQLRRDSERVAG